MARILITAGPTRQYLDPVRYLTNASSGRMGRALAEAALASGHQVVVVSGPVDITYPAAATVRNVVSTEEMLESSRQEFAACDGLIAAAAPCDYRPVRVHQDKMAKTGAAVDLRLVETADIVATLAAEKTHQWLVGFALETRDHRFRALAKLERKSCDLIVSNGLQAIHALDNEVEVIDRRGKLVGAFSGTKEAVAQQILAIIGRLLISGRPESAQRAKVRSPSTR
ncbi:MAG: flavoprotein [Planctomycetes bacterium RBG_16_64_10]|nr:MAG: flavoprotein [Planctomycetes bacterium RBG_16_64_10]